MKVVSHFVGRHFKISFKEAILKHYISTVSIYSNVYVENNIQNVTF